MLNFYCNNTQFISFDAKNNTSRIQAYANAYQTISI